MPHLRDRRPGRGTWRSAVPSIAGALRRSLLAAAAGAAVAFGPEAPESIPCRRRPGFHQPPGLSADASTGTRLVHSPFFVMSREDGRQRGGRQARGTAGGRSVGSKPRQRTTGRLGYRGKRGSVVDRSHNRNVEPRAVWIIREWRHAAHRPGGGPWLTRSSRAPIRERLARLPRARPDGPARGTWRPRHRAGSRRRPSSRVRRHRANRPSRGVGR